MKKSTYILIGLFIGLLIGAFLVLQKPGEQSTQSASRGFLAAIDSVSVDKIEIKTPSLSLVLEKRGMEWTLTRPIQYKADQKNVGQIISQVKNLEVKNTISGKQEKHSVFQVDHTGTEVKIFEKGAEKISFILGKMAANYTESYVRTTTSNDVLLVEGVSSYMFNRPVKEWRDKMICTTPKENIKEVRYQYGDTIFSLVLKDSTWYIGKDKAQQFVVDGILSSLSSLQANDFIDSVISPKSTATMEYAGIQIRFSLNKTLNTYTVQSSNSPQWFLLEPRTANQILKRKNEIVELGKK